MTSEFWIDPSQQVVAQVTAIDTTLVVPETTNLDAINNPNNTGSFWFLSIDNNPVAIAVGTNPAVFANNAILEPGSYLTHPLFLPAGETLHFICGATKQATVSIIRARRAS